MTKQLRHVSSVTWHVTRSARELVGPRKANLNLLIIYHDRVPRILVRVRIYLGMLFKMDPDDYQRHIFQVTATGGSRGTIPPLPTCTSPWKTWTRADLTISVTWRGSKFTIIPHRNIFCNIQCMACTHTMCNTSFCPMYCIRACLIISANTVITKYLDNMYFVVL